MPRYGKRAPAELEFVEFRHCLLCFLVRRHLDERESARAAGGHVAHHAYRFDIAGLAEQFLQFTFSD